MIKQAEPSRTSIDGPRERERIPTTVVPGHDDLALHLARLAEASARMAVQRSPDELEIEAECEDASSQRIRSTHYAARTALTSSMFEKPRSVGLSASWRSMCSHRRRNDRSRPGINRSTQLIGPV